jgi:hypothetical protein
MPEAHTETRTQVVVDRYHGSWSVTVNGRGSMKSYARRAAAIAAGIEKATDLIGKGKPAMVVARGDNADDAFHVEWDGSARAGAAEPQS